MSIKFLPDEIRSKIRSGIAINTLVDCVEALVQNAVDASANCVAVRIDLPFYKIQVVDNGRGINKHDFELVGERYATSKCYHLGDLGNTTFYGYRGEALASLCEISEEVIVLSRAENEDETYAKLFRGTSKQIDVAFRRPSCGTTVTISGFLYNLPVRQAALVEPMELERIRRSLESLAIRNPAVSFSLRDDSSDAWCFRVPRTDSVVSTFSHIFGSVWASALKPVAKSMPPFGISGFFSLKGHRNKNLQFLYVHKQRIMGHRLGEIINQLFGSFPGSNACANSPRCGSESYDKYPVYVLKVKCPAEFYDVGFHPSKTVVEFKKHDVLVELVKSTITTLISENFETTTTQTTGPDHSYKPADSLDSRMDVPLNINAQNYKHSRHSLAAKRAYEPETSNVGVEAICKTPTDVDLNSAQADETLTPKNVSGQQKRSCHISKTNLKSLKSCAEDSARSHADSMPAEGFGPFSNPTPDFPRPIHLSPALDHKRAALGKFIDTKRRQERICKAIADLQRFSHRIEPIESISRTPILENLMNHETVSGQDPREGNGASKNITGPGDLPASPTTEHGVGHHNPPSGSGPSIAEVAMSNRIPISEPVAAVGTANQASVNVPSTKCLRNPKKKRTKPLECRSRFPNQSTFVATDCILQMPLSSECASADKYFPDSNPERNWERLSPMVTRQPTVNQLTSADSETGDQRVSGPTKSQNSERSETTCSRNTVLEQSNAQRIVPASMRFSTSGSPSVAVNVQPESTSKYHVSESLCAKNLEMPPSDEGCDEALGQKRRWLLSTEPQGNRDIYINDENGHSYYGRPPASQTPSLRTTLIAGHPLPLDTSSSDNQLATSILPIRPWSSRITDSDVTDSRDKSKEVEEEQSVERMLQMWENPVFKVNPLLKPSLFYQSEDSDKINTLGFRPYVFHKDIFENIKVIAQVDQKFIVCSVGQKSTQANATDGRRLLVAFDQHAVHERIRLENLIRDAEDDGGSKRLQTIQLDPPLTLHIPSRVARVCLGHQSELMSKGIELSACNDTDGNHTPVCVCQLPSCLVETGKEGTDPPTVEATVIENLLCELVETLENVGTFGAEIPKIIVDALKSQACHGAIKFGDPLSLSTCQNLMTMLGQCKLPFFCAHGRPSIVPLFDYNLLRNTVTETARPKLWKLVGK